MNRRPTICIRGGGWSALFAAAIAVVEYGAEVELRLRPFDPDSLPRPLPPVGQPAWASLRSTLLPDAQLIRYGGFPVEPLVRRTIVDGASTRQMRAVTDGWEVTATDAVWAWSEPADGYRWFWRRMVEALQGHGAAIMHGWGRLDRGGLRSAMRGAGTQLIVLSPAGRWSRAVPERDPRIPDAATGRDRWWVCRRERTTALPRGRQAPHLETVAAEALTSDAWRPWGLVAGRRLQIWAPAGPLEAPAAIWFQSIRDAVRRQFPDRRGDWH